MTDEQLAASLRKMRDDGVSDVGVATFEHYFERLRAGEAGELAESEIEPVDTLPDADELPDDEDGAREALARTVVIKLNGGLGTSMGMTGPKSLLEVKDGLTFLDIVVRQILALRERTGAGLPLVLMNSFATQAPSLDALGAHPDLAVDGLPPDFVQSKVPKLRAGDLAPVEWAADPALEWAPPGHGDLYPSLLSSGLLDALLDAGFAYAFVANVDNLGAVMDERILAWFAREENLSPGGRRSHRGRSQGRPTGPCTCTRRARAARDRAYAGRRRRHVPGHRSPPLLQHQHAVDRPAGAGRGPRRAGQRARAPDDRQPQDRRPGRRVLARGDPARDRDGRGHRRVRRRAAMRVPRERFAPVKTTTDLLALRSDAYGLPDDRRIVLRSGARCAARRP